MATGGRILELIPSQEEAVVARVLVLVHKTVDEHFPSAAVASRQFTKTVFSDDASEQTAIGRPPPELAPASSGGASEAFAEVEVTSPDGRPVDADAAGKGGGAGLPPPPAARSHGPAQNPNIAPASQQPHQPGGGGGAAGMRAEDRPAASSGPDVPQSAMTMIGSSSRRDWQMILTLAMLVAGIILLAYALLT